MFAAVCSLLAAGLMVWSINATHDLRDAVMADRLTLSGQRHTERIYDGENYLGEVSTERYIGEPSEKWAERHTDAVQQFGGRR